MTPARDAALDHLTAKVSDHSSVLQAVQQDMQHMVKAIDKLVGVSEKQAILGAELQRHSESIERAFRQMDGVESKLVQSIDKLAATLKEDRDSAKTVAETVHGYRGSVRTLMWVSGGIWTLIVIIGVMFSQGIKDAQLRSDNEVSLLRSQFEARKQAVDIKVDALSQQVQEVRLDRQRDREAEGMQP